MKLENGCFSNHKLIIDEFNIPVAVQINGKEAFRLYDMVDVTDDGHGYICPGITKPGIGRIVEIRRDMTDHYFGVLMDNGQFGHMKYARMERMEGF